jgi:hypothetical protein
MTINRTNFNRTAWLVIGLMSFVILTATNGARACSTPVYRYAMYRWFPAPYTIFYFHDSEPSEADLVVHKLIEGYADYEKADPANIDLVSIDMAKDPELKRLPPFLRKAWQEGNDGSLPGYMVVSPLGDNLHRGKLTTDHVKALVESSARAEIVKQIEVGKTCVYVMLTCSDEAKNKKAEEAAKKAIKVVQSGEVEFYDGELPYWGEEEEEEGDDAKKAKDKKPTHTIGWLKVDRKSKTENWLVSSLLSVEYDLAEIDEPMIFAVFGRGRALPPYVGKGVTEDNLLDYFAEVTGACSCTVKDQNPGMDLLIKYDWDSVAEKMSQRYAGDEGAGGSVTDLFPQLLIPGEATDEEKDEKPEKPAASDGETESAPASSGAEEAPSDASGGDSSGGQPGPDAE